ncbi:hypothetical protein C8Q70DRAFT_637140 [Cubamyces menziesii]|nr:hypothetical protein C8Q70DRAFT_637140 [Cubamyces menziesii]
MSRWVWVIGVTLLIIIAGAIGLGWYVSHNSTTHNAPTAIGGSANEKAIDAQTSTTAVAEAMATSTVLHVSPTNTVARRDARIGSTLCKPIDMDGALTSTARRINLLLALATHMSSGNVLVPALWDRCHSYDPSPVRSFYDPNPLTHPPASPCIDSSICSSRSTL